MFKKCLQGLYFSGYEIELEKHPLSRLLHWLVRLIYLPPLLMTLYYGDLSSYLLLFVTFLFFECFAITHIVSILTDAFSLEFLQKKHKTSSSSLMQSAASLPDDWHIKIRSAVAHNQLHCGNCGKKRSGFSITNYPDNLLCEHCDTRSTH